MGRKLSSRRQQQLVKAARKRLRKKGVGNRAAAGKVKIQTAAPWKRMLVGLLALVWLWLSFYLYQESVIAALIFFLLFVITVIFAVFGSRKTIDSALDGVDSAVSTRLIDSIFDELF